MKGEGSELSIVYSQYLAGEYKTCLSSLQKLAKQPGQRNLNVLHNLYLMEYLLARSPQQAATAFGKLSDLVNDLRKGPQLPPPPPPQQKGKNNPAANKPQEERQTRHDEGILRYNMAVLAGCVGRRDSMEMILDELYHSGPNQFSWKVGFLLLESQLLLDKKVEALQVLRKLNRTRIIPKRFTDKEEKTKTKFTGLTYPDSSIEFTEICEEEYSFLLDIFRAQLAMQFGLVKTAQKLLPKRQTARIFQGIRQNSFVYKNTNLFELNLLSILKFTTAQCDYRNRNYERALRTLSPHSLMQAQINSPKYLTFISHLALNNIGLINFRLEKYTLALYFISKSLQNVNKVSSAAADEREQLIVQHFQGKQEYLLLNQALVLLKLNKPKEAYEHFCRINKPTKSYKFWYRFGQAALQHYHELLVENGQNYDSELYDQLHDSYDTSYSNPNLPYVKMHDERKKPANALQKPPFYSRYVLRRSDQFIEEESLEEDKKINSRQSRLLHLKPILNKAQNALENCYVCLTRVDIEKTLDGLDLKHISTQQFVEDLEAEQEECHTKELLQFEHNNFKQSCLLMLAYISLCKQQYPKTIKQCTELLQLHKLTEENGYIASMYLVEAYLETERYKEAIDVSLNKWLKLGQKSSMPVRCRDSLAASESHFDSMSADNITRYNMAVLHIKGNNLTQANNVIQQLLIELGITVNSVAARIPVPVLNLLIYWNIRTDNVEHALQLIKRRRILSLPSLNNNKALLRITK